MNKYFQKHGLTNRLTGRFSNGYFWKEGAKNDPCELFYSTLERKWNRVSPAGNQSKTGHKNPAV